MDHAATQILSCPNDAIAAAMCEVNASADAIIQILRVARALVLSGRLICLDGLEQQVARLCARCLGLHPQDGQAARLHLLALRAEMDATIAIFSHRHDAAPCRCTTS